MKRHFFLERELGNVPKEEALFLDDSLYDKEPDENKEEKMFLSRGQINRIVRLIGMRLMGLDETKKPNQLEVFLLGGMREIGTLTITRPTVLHSVLAVVLADFAEREAETVQVLANTDSDRPAEHFGVEVAFGKNRKVVSEGAYFIRHQDTPFVFHIYEREYCGTTLDILYHLRDAEKAERLHDRLIEKLERGNFYKGQKLYLRLSRRGADMAFMSPAVLNASEVVLPEDLYRVIRKNTLGWLRNADSLRKAGLPTRRGVLVYGPPGTGKTMLFKSLFREAEGVTGIVASTETFNEPEEITRVFATARGLAPSLLCFEDLDLIGGERRSAPRHENVFLAALLAELDGVRANEEIIVMASTNSPEVIDRALADRPGRFDVVLEIKPPAEPERKRLFGMFLNRLDGALPREVTEKDMENLARQTAGYTGAHLAEAVTRAYSDCIVEQRGVLTGAGLQEAVASMKKPGKGVGF